MINIKNITEHIIETGLPQNDTIEVTGATLSLVSIQIGDLLNNVILNKKYKPELEDIQNWYDWHYPMYNKNEHRRRQVYFNNSQYDQRFQCISLFQIIDDEMFIYQRSSHTEKMTDDFRFFAEIVQRWFPNVTYIKIFYGSLHTQKNKQ
jgi:hypothetical protein